VSAVVLVIMEKSLSKTKKQISVVLEIKVILNGSCCANELLLDNSQRSVANNFILIFTFINIVNNIFCTPLSIFLAIQDGCS
jgi:hypothetical protein